MKTIKQDYQLLIGLIASSWIAAQGVRVARTLTGPVAIWLRDDYLGVWWHENNQFHFGLAAFRSPERSAKTADEALAMTIALVVKRSCRTPRAAASHSAASVPNWSSDRRA